MKGVSLFKNKLFMFVLIFLGIVLAVVIYKRIVYEGFRGNKTINYSQNNMATTPTTTTTSTDKSPSNTR